MAETLSPRYPGASLPESISRVKRVWDAEERTSLTPERLAAAMGFDTLSGTARTHISAAKKYGLVVKSGNGWKVSDRAIQILLKPNSSPEYRDAIREAVYGVDLLQSLLSTHGKATKETIESHLVTEENFTRSGARTFSKAFFETKELLASHESAILSPPTDELTEHKNGVVGASVQWTSQGIMQFQKPRKVKSLQEHNDGQTYLEVEDENGETGWIPMAEATVVEEDASEREAERPLPAPKITPQKPSANMRQDVYDLDEGPVELKRPAKLSRASFEELSDWFDLLKRKLERSIDEQSEE